MGANATWDNNPELRDGVRRRLINWGWHYSGSNTGLDYPTHQPFTTPPQKTVPRPPEYIGQEDADKVEHLITSAAQASLHCLRNAIILRTEYVYASLAQETKAKKLGYKRSTYQNRVAAADLWFFELSKSLE